MKLVLYSLRGLGSGRRDHRQPRNRALTDIVTARDAPLRLARFEALAGLFLLVRREDRLAAEPDAVGLGVSPAARGALQNAATLQLCGKVGKSITKAARGACR